MVPVVDNSSFSPSEVDNVTLDEHSESCDVVSNTENTAEYEQRVFKGKNKNVVMESGIELRQDAGFGGDGDNCLFASVKMCTFAWVGVYLFCVFIGFIVSMVAGNIIGGVFDLVFGIAFAVLIILATLKQNGCLLMISLICLIFKLIYAIAWAIVRLVFIGSAKTSDGKKYLYENACKEESDKQGCVDAYVACAWTLFFFLLIELTALIFLTILVVKQRNNAR